MKISPYYRNEKERQQLISLRDSFVFSEVEELPKMVVLIAGKEGSGKTHLACTMTELGPVYLIDTEYRAQIVTRKFSGVKFAVVKSFTEMAVAVQHILKHQPDGTIVLDPGSDLQTFAEIEYLERAEKEKVGMPWNWAEVWRLCNAIINDIKFSKRFNLVITARLKEEYVNDRGTGNLVPRVYSPLPYKADVMLQFSDGKEKKLLLTKNGFTGERGEVVDAGASLPQIIKQLSRSAPPLVERSSRMISPRIRACATILMPSWRVILTRSFRFLFQWPQRDLTIQGLV